MSYRRTSSGHTLMLVVFRRAHLSIKLDPNLFEQPVQPSGIALGAAPHGAMRIHRHCARRVSAMSKEVRKRGSLRRKSIAERSTINRNCLSRYASCIRRRRGVGARAKLGAKSRLVEDAGVGYRRKATNYRREPRNANWTDADKMEACERP